MVTSRPLRLGGLTVFGQGSLPEVKAVNPIRRSLGKMTKSNKFLLTGAAVAGLLAGTSASIQASNLLPGAKASASAQDTEKKSDKKVKEKHACKGQNSCKGKGGCKSSDNGCKGKNSCKGKGGCATDGSKPPAAWSEAGKDAIRGLGDISWPSITRERSGDEYAGKSL